MRNCKLPSGRRFKVLARKLVLSYLGVITSYWVSHEMEIIPWCWRSSTCATSAVVWRKRYTPATESPKHTTRQPPRKAGVGISRNCRSTRHAESRGHTTGSKNRSTLFALFSLCYRQLCVMLTFRLCRRLPVVRSTPSGKFEGMHTPLHVMRYHAHTDDLRCAASSFGFTVKPVLPSQRPHGGSGSAVAASPYQWLTSPQQALQKRRTQRMPHRQLRVF